MINIVKVQDHEYTEALQNSVKTLDSGGVVVFPTDTAYGLAARADLDEALKKVVEIKRRSPDKGLSMIVRDFKHLQKYAETDDRIHAFFDLLFPGPFTFLLKARKKVSGLLTGRYPTVAVRVPHHPFTKQLSEAVSYAFTSTSANLSGNPCKTDPNAIIADLAGGSVQPDLVIDDGIFESVQFSTILDLTQQPYVITRVGVVSKEELTQTLRGLV